MEQETLETVDKVQEKMTGGSDPVKAEEPNKTKIGYEENQLIGEEWTFDGPIEKRWIKGAVTVVVPPEVREVPVVPKTWRPRHSDALYLILLLRESLPQQKDRTLPLLQSEVLKLVPKKDLRDLEVYELVKTRLLSNLMLEGRRTSGAMVCWLTPTGQYLAKQLKKHFEKIKQEKLAAQKSAPIVAQETVQHTAQDTAPSSHEPA